MRFIKGFTPLAITLPLLLLTASVLIAEPATTHSKRAKAPLPPAKEFRAVIEQTLTSSRNEVRKTIDLVNKVSDADYQLIGIRAKLDQKYQEASLGYEKNVATVKDTLAERFGLEVSKEFLNAAIDYQTRLGEFTKRYERYLGLPVANPQPLLATPIGGFVDSERPAVRGIISSQVTELRLISKLVDTIDDILESKAAEITSLSNNLNQSQLEFGSDYYVEHILSSLDVLIESTEKTRIFMEDKNLDGQTQSIKACSGSFYIDSLATIAQELNSKVDLGAIYATRSSLPTWTNYFDSWLSDNFNPIRKLFKLEGGEIEGYKGHVNHWNICISNAANLYALRKADYELAKNTKTFDWYNRSKKNHLAMLAHERDYIRYKYEAELIGYQLSQLQRFKETAALQRNNLNYDQGEYLAWGHTLLNDTNNNQFSPQLYIAMLKSLRNLLNIGKVEAAKLKQAKTADELRLALQNLNGTFNGIRIYAIDRMRGELDYVYTAFDLFTDSLVSTSSFEDIINEYLYILNSRLDDHLNEQNNIAQLIESADSKLDIYNQQASDSFDLMKSHENRLGRFLSNIATINEGVELLTALLSQRFSNPLYSAMLSRLRSEIALNPVFATKLGKFDKVSQKALKKFDSFGTGQFCVNTACVPLRKFSKGLRPTVSSFNTGLKEQLSAASAAQLNGIGITEWHTKIEQAYNENLSF